MRGCIYSGDLSRAILQWRRGSIRDFGAEVSHIDHLAQGAVHASVTCDFSIWSTIRT